MNKDPYKIPLAQAQEWCKNWIDLKEKESELAEEEKYNPKEMRAFLVAKQDLLDLFEQAPDAQFVRFYLGLKEGKGKKTPHLLMVNAEGDSPKTAKDLVGIDSEEGFGSSTMPVNDFSHPCPSVCDSSSPLYV